MQRTTFRVTVQGSGPDTTREGDGQEDGQSLVEFRSKPSSHAGNRGLPSNEEIDNLGHGLTRSAKTNRSIARRERTRQETYPPPEHPLQR
ncbi:hypothetical protein FA13DRAFT_1726552 [Coprinellus micaceus]|uniref:Uncharacterized protein n=1 Tax=Coprinellus micaceus TaxID=71717 RepID=A0A4Y7TTG2_COPMI|nr:hypothetical protein FA13DRAFT_1726552 [Coprinellus micaceus]